MRAELIKQLENYQPLDQDEADGIPQIIDLLRNHDRCFWRDHIPPGHITGSALLLNKTLDKTLLTHHAFLNRWLQFGGHADGDENILNVALRECVEESGIENVKPFTTDIFDVDVHPIPKNPKKNEAAHHHYDICFAFYCPDDTPFVISDESNDLKWFSLDELKEEHAANYNKRYARLIPRWEKILQSKAA